MIYTMDDNPMKGRKGTYADLLTEEYGGMEVYGEEWKAVKELLGVEKPEEIIITTDEDGEKEDYDRFNRIHDLFPISISLNNNHENYSLHEIEGVRFVFSYGPIYVIFIKAVDREKFNEITNKL